MKRLSLLVLVFLVALTLSAQTGYDRDSISNDTVSTRANFSVPEARVYLGHVVNNNSLWRMEEDSVRKALQRLLDHSEEPFDSTRNILLLQDFSQVRVHAGEPIVVDSNEVKWLNDTTFLVDPHGWSPDLYLNKESRLVYPEDSTGNLPSRSSLALDSSLVSAYSPPIPDTLHISWIDTSAIESLGISLHQNSSPNIYPTLNREGLSGRMSEDSSKVYYYQPGISWQAEEDSPFLQVEGEYQLDSLQLALKTLLEFTLERDSTLLWVNDMYGSRFPYWLSQGDDEAYRFWIRNYNNDSITVWIGNPAHNEISLILEDDVSINRLKKEDIHYLPEFLVVPERSLLAMEKLKPDPIYWDFGFGSSFSLNQSYLSNWTKGGESSFSTILDLLGEATYNNKEANTQWANSMRLNFGTIKTKENGNRKNQDLFEINSKFNRNAWGKIGMSTTLYMKTQLARGYKYPNDSVPVSKFINPASITVGLGFEYKPMKNTSLNLAPLSYKNTFVLDTVLIDQTKFGIEKEKKVKQEMGLQLVVNNKVNPFKDLTIVNNIRLFSNYLNRPQNIDVDWELTLDQKINWFFTIRLNLHLIYDDDIRFTVFDSEELPVYLPDGSEKTVAKAQFKEFIGLSLQFKF